MAATAVGAAVSIGTAYMAKKQQDKQMKMAQKSIDASDPLAKDRQGYVQQLNDLMKNPSSITDTPEYKARQEAAARQMSAQGYTGSGNAIIEAANAGGASYQQAFENLSSLAGAGATPGAGYGNALQTASNTSDTTLGAYAGVANNLANMAEAWKGGAFNKNPGIGPVERQPLVFNKPKVDIGH